MSAAASPPPIAQDAAAALLKAGKRALATLLALGYREERNNVVQALREAIARAEGGLP